MREEVATRAAAPLHLFRCDLVGNVQRPDRVEVGQVLEAVGGHPGPERVVDPGLAGDRAAELGDRVADGLLRVTERLLQLVRRRLLIGVLNLPSLAITLGTLAAYRGLAYVILGDEAVSGFPTGFTNVGGGYVRTELPVARQPTRRNSTKNHETQKILVLARVRPLRGG